MWPRCSTDFVELSPRPYWGSILSLFISGVCQSESRTYYLSTSTANRSHDYLNVSAGFEREINKSRCQTEKNTLLNKERTQNLHPYIGYPQIKL